MKDSAGGGKSSEAEFLVGRLLTPDEVCRLLGYSPGALRWRARNREIEQVRLGPRTVRYEATAVEAYIARGRRRAQPKDGAGSPREVEPEAVER